MIDVDSIRSARPRIDPIFLDTPAVNQPALDDYLGCTLVAKVETVNPIRSFKGRGTELFVATEARPGEVLVCASAGNFGQGLARAAATRGYRCVVFAAEGANPLKVAAMRRFGAEVRLAGADFDAAKQAARAYAQEAGARFVEDGAEPAIAAGAGTMGIELAAQAPGLAALLVPLGNGALLAGVGAAFRHAAPQVEIVGVVAAQAPAMQRSLLEERAIETPRADTIADGIAVRVPVPAALAMLQGCYDAIVSVSESGMLRAVQIADEYLGLVIEPAGAAGLAAIAEARDHYRGRKVATILCGGNIAPDLRDRLVVKSR
jgi:threonine dehydratase